MPLPGVGGLVLGGWGLVSDGFRGEAGRERGDGQVLLESCEGFFGLLPALGDLFFERLDEGFGLFVLVHQVLLDGCWFRGSPFDVC